MKRSLDNICTGVAACAIDAFAGLLPRRRGDRLQERDHAFALGHRKVADALGDSAGAREGRR